MRIEKKKRKTSSIKKITLYVSNKVFSCFPFFFLIKKKTCFEYFCLLKQKVIKRMVKMIVKGSLILACKPCVLSWVNRRYNKVDTELLRRSLLDSILAPRRPVKIGYMLTPAGLIANECFAV